MAIENKAVQIVFHQHIYAFYIFEMQEVLFFLIPVRSFGHLGCVNSRIVTEF